jgi:hypothetical protein
MLIESPRLHAALQLKDRASARTTFSQLVAGSKCSGEPAVAGLCGVRVNGVADSCLNRTPADSPEFSHRSVKLRRIDHAELWRVQLPTCLGARPHTSLRSVCSACASGVELVRVRTPQPHSVRTLRTLTSSATVRPFCPNTLNSGESSYTAQTFRRHRIS